MNKKVLSAAVLATAVMALSSCSTSRNAQKDKNETIMDNGVVTRPSADMDIDPTFLIMSDAQRDIVKRNNQFAFNLFHQMTGMESKVVSPVSVAYLMGILANGAEGQTQEEILKAIGCEGVDLKQLNECYMTLIQTAGKLDKQTTVNIANFVAINKNYQLNKHFAQTVADYYKAGLESMDFTSATSTSRINNWCKEHTDGMIPQIIDQVDPSAVSYLMNAIYFNGTWQEKFDERNTKKENFQGYTRNIQKVDMMHQNRKFFYMENEMLKAVELPYGNGTYNMLVLLPNADKSISEMMKSLNPEMLKKFSSHMDQCQVDLKLPRFTTEMELPLNDIIGNLGAPSMFLPGKANFSQFANGEFFVSKMLQKAKIEVSEQGTKAAAVSAAIMVMSAMPHETRRVEFHANRPFVYLIQDRNSGAILFMGQYTGNN